MNDKIETSKVTFHMPNDRCCECGDKISPMESYMAYVDIEGRRHAYTGHKHCVGITVRKAREIARVTEQIDNMTRTNKEQAHLLKNSPDDVGEDDVLDEFAKNLEKYMRENTRTKPRSFIYPFDSGHGG